VKRYWPIIVATVAPVLAVILIYLSVPATQEARAQLDRDVDRELAKARRLLAAYSPGEQLLLATQERLTRKGSPLQITDGLLSKWSADWGKITSYADQESPVKPVSPTVERELTEANRLLSEYNGGEPKNLPTPSANATAAYKSTEEWLKANAGRLKEAIAVVDSALAMNVTTSEGMVSGRDIPEADRLRAILSYHYAESRYQNALMNRADIQRLSTRLVDVYGQWIAVTSDLGIAEQALTGKPVPAPGTTTAPGTASAPAGTSAASAPAPSGPAKPSKLLHKIFGAVSLKGRAAGERPVEAASQPAEAPATGPEAEKPRAIVPAARTEPVEPLPERIARLEKEKAAAISRIAALGEQIQSLRGTCDAIAAKIKAKRAEAADADKKMVELENQGFDPSHPDVLKKRTAEYEAASKISREASREADLLEFGGYRNATLVGEQTDWRAVRIAPAKPGELLEPQKSLQQYKQELSSAQAALEGERNVVAILANRIDGLQKMQIDFEVRIGGGKAATTQPVGSQPTVPGLKGRRTALAAEAKQIVDRIVEAAKDADANEDAAIAEIDKGLSAARQAKQAIVKRQSDAKAAQPAEGEPNPRLQKIEQENWRVGDADAMQGDLQLLQAWIRYQRADAKRRLASTLTVAQQMGMEVNPQAERTAADEQREPAVTAAQAATKAYETAEPDFKKDWTLQADLAAAYYLLSQLTQGAEAQKYRADAIRAYQAGVAGQETNPDRKPYVNRLESIEREKVASSTAAK
jgi:hypothetical protein